MSTHNTTGMKDLNSATVKAATTLHEHKFSSYTKTEAEAALKFLELSSLYGYYENLSLSLTTEKISGEYGERDSVVEKLLTSAVIGHGVHQNFS